MKLRNKVLILISLVWAGFLIITYSASHYFLLHHFLTLENERATRDINRVYQALDQNITTLDAYTADWSHWTEAYNFMSGKNPQFISTNFKIPTFVNSNINFISYWNAQGKQVAGKAIDTMTQKYTSFPNGLENYLYSDSPLVKSKNHIHGFIQIQNGIMLISSSLVTNGYRQGTYVGKTIFGRLLSPKILQHINETTQVKTVLYLPQQIESNRTLLKAFKAAYSLPNGLMINPYDKNTIHGYLMIKDIYGKPIGMLQTSSTRIIYLSGLRMINYFLFCFITLGVLFSILMLWLLHIVIIKRLELLDKNVSEISKDPTLTQRLSIKGNDEIVSLANQINSMMDIIETSKNKLEYRVKERTQELQQTNLQLQQEIAERKTIEKDLTTHKEHLVRVAHYDSLTNLPNRFFFNEMLTKTLSYAKRKKNKFAILYIDLDSFKTINDALGHLVGDVVLKEISSRFLKLLRADDILARLGGDEFVILLHDIDQANFATTISERILQICSQPIKVDNNEFVLTCSIGISIYPEDGDSLENLLKNADMAMYKAKQAGGSVYQYYSKEMELDAHERIKLDASLRKAINNNEFTLYYQPKLQLSDGTIMGVEALIRWENPVLGLISPEKFIPIAEETGLIIPIGEWVLREACKTNKLWQEQGYKPITVAVNLSAKQFRHSNIAQMISKILVETKLDPKYLELEITETAIMDNVNMAVETLHRIEEMGVNISIDDFGTGYTSISYLKQFPVSTIKIDQSFIKELPNSQDDASITNAVIALAHSLGITVVAEGVETPQQLQFLIDHHCDMVQGYYFSHPLSGDAILAQLTKIQANTSLA